MDMATLVESGQALDKMIVDYEESTNFDFYADRDRRTSLAWLADIFAGIAINFSQLRVFLALVGMTSLSLR